MRKGAGSLQIWVLDEPLSGCVTWSQPVPLPGPQSPQLDSEKGNQMISPHLPLLGGWKAWVLEPARPEFHFCLHHLL